MGRILGVEINEGKNADGKMSDSTMADVEPCIRTCFRLHRWEIAKSVVLWSDLKGYITAYSTINGIDKQTFFMSAQSGTPSASTRLAYPGGKIPLKEAKANDIKKALQYVPVEHLEFYNEIVNGPIGTAEEDLMYQSLRPYNILKSGQLILWLKNIFSNKIKCLFC
ncbi:hypothetical protein J6590_007379 [Homalodisca vitripennis]|nr:hypothetical protein J6590_007379 [Homalodisca vitripennis]